MTAGLILIGGNINLYYNQRQLPKVIHHAATLLTVWLTREGSPASTSSPHKNELFVPYAEPDSKTEALCKKWIEQGKTARTFDSKYTENLFELGVKVI